MKSSEWKKLAASMRGGNNYTRGITLARASSMPKYMQLLQAIAEHPRCTRKSLVWIVWKKELSSSKDNFDGDVSCNWNNGPFTMLRQRGFIDCSRSGEGEVEWFITSKGSAFLKSTCTKKIGIDIASPECYGAPYPEFDKLKINERRFEHGLRPKYWDIWIQNGRGFVNWKSQEDEDPTSAWEAEVKRAFKANGLKCGQKIYVKFGSRDVGYVHDYVLKA